ncbi:coiled-coil domain-containing protein 32 isoform X1 [Pongo pygmaeus]|uniref:CCDC32 isoform 1 n=4 Tax=Pongo abelii TaxID=9601 RepID=A0A6D2WU48_PONAB|nr:coiled-coil domain-containing protein 32 isoform X1 [Pongo abelii]XP_003778475.1 coiled-coil domain-containing protein 32 isoform X1 [Pongo abelii]XP_054306242.1 coiled-coil domain-containing protein 32 [Pongo pygmaeus]XP_054387368.1 coiled-coil domain-containing protein 32 isoform X1 [Pongo abelii]PNJ27447.1 CCDC32 isoform 1 [Pongo abelii]PNJ27449.1 CCDC32 isoform 3 [Pongo abelii]PNJ27452.1 CCDC32 isoform 7 [Pongo abelii]PNJ27453.1 CCDC32 isoform 8 [Pongo abelii]PNJ27454.1 CCDC32 isofor
MKMFESADSAATRSGQDLWAEICSCLPNPDQEDGVNNAFSDSFVDSCPEGEGQREVADFAVQPTVKPWAPLQDSEVYLASLEKKLRRIKGLNQEVTSKDMLRTLAQAKKECWDRFLQEKLASEFFVDGLDSDESTLEHFKRWLQPDKVAISTEEVQYLIPPESQVEKPVAEDEPAAGDKPAAAEQ